MSSELNKLTLAGLIFLANPLYGQQVISNNQRGGQVIGKVVNTTNRTTNNNRYSISTVQNLYVNISELQLQQLAKRAAPQSSPSGTYSSVVIVPKLNGTEDIYQAFGNPTTSSLLASVTQIFSDSGFTITPFPDHNTVAKRRLPLKAATDLSQAIFLSGADVCIEVAMLIHTDGDENAVTIVLSAFDRDNGVLLSQKKNRTQSFRTQDYAMLADGILPQLTAGLIGQLRKLAKKT